jgi:asparagine synthase (glutamine-hydrolysing)
MCGIWALLNSDNYDNSILYKNFMNIKHRGPDFSSFQNYKNLILGFHRLSIMELSFKSNQPFILKHNDNTIIFVCNGEIYNYKELINKYNLPIDTNSDCMTLPQLYIKLGHDKFIELFSYEIKGEYAFLLFIFDNDNNLIKTVAGRDHIGIRPLYFSEPTFTGPPRFTYKPIVYSSEFINQPIIFSSEIKGCHFYEYPIKEFPPGHIISIDNNSNLLKYKFNNLYDIRVPKSCLDNSNEILLDLKNCIINSITRRLDSDQPIAFLLSGGVDSSLIAALASRIINKPIKTFCCGMGNGSDLKYAKLVADHIGSEHTEVIFTPDEALEAINDVIYTTETWDTTTIRASVGQYLVSKYISQNTDAKVLFVGEGPDEVCSSYLFNYYAPDPNLIHLSAKEYVSNIHYYDVKRCDKCISRWGLEARVALLDPEFIENYWYIPSFERHPKTRGIEKWWLRQAFSDDNLLPDQVLWRKKEAFSDGISSTEKSWFQIIQEYINQKYNMDEKDYYKYKFIELFGVNRLNIIPDYWQPKWDSNGNEVSNYVDPSARTLDIYSN